MPEQVYRRKRLVRERRANGQPFADGPTYGVELSECGLLIRLRVLDDGQLVEMAQIGIHTWDAIDDAVGELLAEAADRAWKENTAYRLLEGDGE